MSRALRLLDKHKFLQSQACMTKAWLIRNGRSTESSTEADRLRRDEGKEIGERARALFPNGHLVVDLNIDRAMARTRELLADPSVEVLFEGAFLAGDAVARPDILIRSDGGWDLVEVKSALDVDNERLDDLAYTVTVVRAAGTVVNHARLMLLSRSFRLGQTPEQLFVLADCTEDIRERCERMAKLVPVAAKATAAPQMPGGTMSRACKECEYFDNGCIGHGFANPVFDLPRITSPKLSALVAAGIFTIDQIPASFGLSAQQVIVHQAVIAGMPVVNAPALKESLEGVRWPAHYFDFETMSTALPIYAETSPHQALPTQYSVHVCDRPGSVVCHAEYLADPAKDCRRELAERLLTDLDGDGSVVVYFAPFEKRILEQLAATFPDLVDPIGAVIRRLFDLEKCLKPEVYYHPQFHGSSSIKVTLPVLVPELRYDGLAIGDGDTAQALFTRMARGDSTTMPTAKIRESLLEYCKLDTMAMVRIHARLTADCEHRSL